MADQPADAFQRIPERKQERWHVCCSETDPGFVRFCAQLSVSFAVLGLSIFQLAKGNTDALYPSLLTLVLGVYVPTPSHAQKSDPGH
jgi:hypothetical protein